MSNFRFTAEHFIQALGAGKVSMNFSFERIAEIANALLEAEEQKCERIFMHLGGAHSLEENNIFYRPKIEHSTHTALIWNVSTINNDEEK